MTPAHVLVFPCGSEIALEIHRSLAPSRHVRLTGASSVDSNHGKHVFASYRGSVPFVGSPGFDEAIRELVRAEQVDFIYPAHDDALTALAGRDDLGCAVLGAPTKTAAICRSKRRTYEHLRDRVRVPRIYELDERYPLPIFLKPDQGQGSRGVYVADRRAEAAILCDRHPGLVPMEYLPGREYTVDCFTDRHGALRFFGARERVRTANGISTHTVTCHRAEIAAFAQAIHESMTFRGAWFFQLKETADADLAVLEVAPRVSGGMGLFRAQGINLPLLTLWDALGHEVTIPEPNGVTAMDRALYASYGPEFTYSAVYMDFDDTLFHDGLLDPMAVAFIAQCRNKRIPVRLLSRHEGDLTQRLQALGLGDWFDAVHHLTNGSAKADFIAESDAVFIDDSFAEREAVRAAKGIPVFGPDSLEALLDRRA